MIEGETGTGKELVAEAIHEHGPRRDAPFIVFDCTAVPASLIESELFGHEKGAFTGAVARRPGVFEQANGGTLFIDELGELDLQLQPKLLRAMERACVRRVGGSRWINVDVRVIAATRRNLDREVEVGRFRDDLFHRMAVTRIELPPLRHRDGDVRLLARHFWRELGGAPNEFPRTVLERWEEDPWPGNVRELRNAVMRLRMLGEWNPRMDDEDEAQHASGAFEAVLALNLPFQQARDRLLEDFTHCYVERVLHAHGGNVTHAAAASGIGRRYFQKLRSKSAK